MKKFLLVILFCASSVQAQGIDGHCNNVASMYVTAQSLRDYSLTDAQKLVYLKVFKGISERRMQDALDSTRSSGELGYMSAKTLYKHIFYGCKQGRY